MYEREPGTSTTSIDIVEGGRLIASLKFTPKNITFKKEGTFDTVQIFLDEPDVSLFYNDGSNIFKEIRFKYKSS